MRTVIILLCSVFAMSVGLAQSGWILQNSQTTKNLYGISTFDGINAIAVGEKGIVTTTGNEGRPSWNLQQSPTPLNLNGVTSISATILLAVGRKDSIYRSTDRGVTWTGVRSWARGQCWTLSLIHQLSAVDFDKLSGLCTAVGDQNEAIFSEDSGKHWDERLPAMLPGWHLSNFTCVSVSSGTILSSGTPIGYASSPELTQVFTSSDQGDTWINATTDQPGLNMSGETFYGCDSKAWVLVGSGGVIFHSKDKGITWDPIPSGTTVNLNAVRFAPNSLYGYIAGDAGMILSTIDGGYNWTREFAPTKQNLHSIALVDPFHVYICGDSGVILWTQDGGFDDVRSLNNQVFLDVHNFPNPFPSRTTIHIDLPQSGHINLSIYNMLGVEIAKIADGDIDAGSHIFEWNAADIPSGVYVCRLVTDGKSAVSQMVVAK